MFEEAISELEMMGIPYEESEDGTLSIDISDADKTDVVNIVSFLNDNMLDYTIDADSIVVTMPAMPEETEEFEEEMPTDPMAGAMEEMF